MKKFDKEKFLKTELGGNLYEIVEAWNMALDGKFKNTDIVDTRTWCQAQWEVYQIMFRQLYDISYHFTRTDEYYGIVSNDEKDWLIKIER